MNGNILSRRHYYEHSKNLTHTQLEHKRRRLIHGPDKIAVSIDTGIGHEHIGRHASTHQHGRHPGLILLALMRSMRVREVCIDEVMVNHSVSERFLHPRIARLRGHRRRRGV